MALKRDRVLARGVEVAVAIGGSGPPLLLLHGFPETHRAWLSVAERLQERFTLVLPDLPGYGDSSAPPDPAVDAFTKRSFAAILADVMAKLGFAHFAVAAHDRGARVAYRLALDRPELVRQLALLDILPTLEMVEGLNYERARRMTNWFFLAEPAPVPEMLIECDPGLYLAHILDSWAGTPGAITLEARAEYLRCFRRPGVIAASCNDYRATDLDAQHDREDRDHGRRIACPLLLLWAAEGLTSAFGDPIAIWRRWADDVRGRALPAGHFLMEEAPELVAAELSAFFSPPRARGAL